MKPISLSGMARFAVAMASLGLAVAIVYRSAAESGSGPSPAKYQPSWESLDRHPLAPWWQEAKFGVYVHWSLASVPAWGNHSSFYWPNLLKSQRLEAEGPRAPKIDIAEEYVGLWQFHQKTYGAQFKFEDFAPLFRAEVFDADRWANLFVRSGARYVVLTTKHHDGFCLWPNAEASRTWGHPWNSMEVGPKRDLVGELTNAVRKRGLKTGHYFSFYEWYNPLWLKDKSRFVSEHMLPQLKDLVLRYQPDILWADGEWEGTDTLWRSREFLAWLFNESPVPDIVIDDRWGQGCRHQHGGFYTTEFTAGMADGSHPWEENRTTVRPRAFDAEGRPLWYDWVHNRQLGATNYYSARELVLTLIDTVSRGGNLLLNVGATADGLIPAIEEERLLQIGEWLKLNGEAIYGTRPWRTSCQWSEGTRPQIQYGQEWRVNYNILEITAKPAGGKAGVEAFFIAKGDTLYAMLPRSPAQPLVLKDVWPTKNTTGTLLQANRTVKWKRRGADLVIGMPGSLEEDPPSGYPFVLKITAVGNTSNTAGPKAFSTRFEGTESPLSESGVWSNNGLDWTKIRKEDGIAFGTQTGTNTGVHRYNDSYAHLSGFPPDQEAWGEARILKPNESCDQELEILLRFTSAPHRTTGYECFARCITSASSYLQVVRWDGPLGKFTYLADKRGTNYGLNNGDILKASIIGNVITVYVNGVEKARVRDDTFKTGDPGIGEFLGCERGRGVGSNSDFGFASFTARSIADTNARKSRSVFGRHSDRE